MDTAQLQQQAGEAARRAGAAASQAASQFKNQINQWSTMDTPPSPFEKFVPEKLKGQWNVFPFIYPRIGEPINSNFLKAMGAEFLGTCLFLFILVSQIVFSCLLRDNVNELGKATCLLNPVRVMPIAGEWVGKKGAEVKMFGLVGAWRFAALINPPLFSPQSRPVLPSLPLSTAPPPTRAAT